MTELEKLNAELDAWRALGRRAAFWWRDDDAAEPTPALERLLDLAARHKAPLMLAVIPARASAALARRIAEAGQDAVPDAVPVQHGFAHLNHAPADEKKWELGAHRPLPQVLEDLRRGRARMEELFAETWMPVLVPPWNRIAPPVTARLGDLGYTGLSAHTPRPAALAAPGVTQVNTHADIMRWQAPRGFLGSAAVLEALTAHLSARRDGLADAAEPTGILTHHLAHDDACWAFLETLLTTLQAHPAADLIHPRRVFAPASDAAPQGARGAA